MPTGTPSISHSSGGSSPPSSFSSRTGRELVCRSVGARSGAPLSGCPQRGQVARPAGPLQPQREHSHGLADKDFDDIFTRDKPIIFAFHGYPWLIHRLTYRRTNHDNLHVRGYKEEGTTTTPFDMVVLNDLDRFHLVGDVIDRVPALGARMAYVKQTLRDRLLEHKEYIDRHGDDIPEIRDWKWGAQRSTGSGMK